MLKKDVRVGAYYAIKHTSTAHGRLSVIKIEGVSIYGGWNATNLKTKRMIRIKAATKLRCEVIQNPEWVEGATGIYKWIRVEPKVAS